METELTAYVIECMSCGSNAWYLVQDLDHKDTFRIAGTGGRISWQAMEDGRVYRHCPNGYAFLWNVRPAEDWETALGQSIEIASQGS